MQAFLIPFAGYNMIPFHGGRKFDCWEVKIEPFKPRKAIQNWHNESMASTKISSISIIDCKASILMAR
jgi:hypothetical protein